MTFKMSTILTATTLFAALVMSFGAFGSVDTTSFNQPGQSDDAELQTALTYCSDHGETCVIPQGKMYLITTDLFIWGNSSLIGGGNNAGILFKPNDASRALLQVGLAPQNMVYHATTPYIPKPIFTGKINNLTLKVDGAVTRGVLTALNDANPDPAPEKILRPYKLIFFWRTEGAEVSNNYVDVANSKYGFTSAGNNANYVPAGTATPGAWVGKWPVRKNIRIVNNRLTSDDYKWTLSGKDSDGNEGIALVLFDGAYIAHNVITGFGDDVIAFHYGKNAIIEQNFGDSVDGRIYVSGSSCVAVLYNDVVRRPTTLYHNSGVEEYLNGWGVSMLALDGENTSKPPTQNIIYGNKLFVPAGLREDGILIYGARATQISHNSLYQPADPSIYGPILPWRWYTTQPPIAGLFSVKTGLRLRPLDYINPQFNEIATCFQGTNLSLPNGLSFLPISGDNYDKAISSYMPVKNIQISNNNFSPSNNGGFTSASIRMVEPPEIAARVPREPSLNLFGNVSDSAETCNSSTIVGAQACHAVSVINNRVDAMPWQICNQAQFSNLPGPGVTLDPLSCLFYQSAAADYIAGNVTKLQRASSPFFERVYYDNNSTQIDGNAQSEEPAFTVPGMVPAEYFHDAYTNGVSSITTEKKCKNPFANKLTAIQTGDMIGDCDLKGFANQWAEYNVSVLEAGNYTLNLRAKSMSAQSNLLITIDNQEQFSLIVNRSAVPAYSDYRFANIPLTQGKHKVKIYFLSGTSLLNYLQFEIFR